MCLDCALINSLPNKPPLAVRSLANVTYWIQFTTDNCNKNPLISNHSFTDSVAVYLFILTTFELHVYRRGCCISISGRSVFPTGFSM